MQAGHQPAFPRSAGSAPVAHEIKILRELIWLVGGPACGFARDDWVRLLAYGIGF